MSGDPVIGSLFIYAPNKVLPVVFAVLFAISLTAHLWQCICFGLLGLQPLCACLFTVGFAMREYGAFNYIYNDNDTNLIVFILSQVFIYICPPLLELCNYHVLGRLFGYVPHLAPLPPRKVLAIFAPLMLLVEALNGVGVSLTANSTSTKTVQKIGSQMTIAALALQLFVISFCALVMVLFHWRCHKTRLTQQTRAFPAVPVTMYTSLVLILIRSIYRIVEHTGDTATDIDSLQSLRALSPLLREEWFFYVFEAGVMFLNSVLWNVIHPARYVPVDSREYLNQDGNAKLRPAQVAVPFSWLRFAGWALTFGAFFHQKKKADFEELVSLRDVELSRNRSPSRF